VGNLDRWRGKMGNNNCFLSTVRVLTLDVSRPESPIDEFGQSEPRKMTGAVEPDADVERC
jgi:hypothetical protein